MHTNGLATGGRISGVESRPSRLQGPSFTVFLSSSSDTSVELTIHGSAAPEQVLRLLAQSDVLRGDTRVTVTLETDGGYDEYTYTGDLLHRVLFRRCWDRVGRSAVFYGLNPFVGDTDGPVDRVPNRASLRNVVGALSHDGPLARVDVMNLFTFRSADAASLPATENDRLAIPELERRVLSEADVVLLAWGSKVSDQHRPAVERLLSVLDDVGKPPSMLSRGGQLLTVGNPPQPAHPARLGYRDVRVVQVDGGTVLGTSSLAASPTVASPVDVSRRAAAGLDGVHLPAPRPVHRIPPRDGTETTVTTNETHQAVAWYDAHLDALGREALRRLLAGEQHSPPHPDVASPEDLLKRAHDAGGPRDALDLAVAAHRIVTGIAWRWVGARYLLVTSDLSPDLEDRRADGKKVTGKPYADAAREALSRLVRSPAVVGNDLAPGNQPGLAFDDVARRWGVSNDLIGGTLGPGAGSWIDTAATVIVGKTPSGQPYYKVIKEYANWRRPAP